MTEIVPAGCLQFGLRRTIHLPSDQYQDLLKNLVMRDLLVTGLRREWKTRFQSMKLNSQPPTFKDAFKGGEKKKKSGNPENATEIGMLCVLGEKSLSREQ